MPSFMKLPREIRLQILEDACALPPVINIADLSARQTWDSPQYTLVQTTFFNLFKAATLPQVTMLAHEMVYIAENRKKQAKIGRQYCRDKHKEAREMRAKTSVLKRWKELDMMSKMWHHAENYFGLQISLARLECMKFSALENTRVETLVKWGY